MADAGKLMRDATGCGDCALHPDGALLDRRRFLGDATATVLGVLATLGMPRSAGAAPSIVFATGAGSGPEKAYPIPATDGAVIDRDESVIVARAAAQVFAFSLACPHQNTALRWDERNTRFQCPKHKSRYRPDGTFIEGRATRGLDRFAVRRDADRLMVNLDLLYREDEHAAEWSRAFVSLADAR